MTSNLDRAGLAGNVLLDSAVTGLPKDAVAVPLGLELVERSWLVERVGQLPRPLVDAVSEATMRSYTGTGAQASYCQARPCKLSGQFGRGVDGGVWLGIGNRMPWVLPLGVASGSG